MQANLPTPVFDLHSQLPCLCTNIIHALQNSYTDLLDPMLWEIRSMRHVSEQLDGPKIAVSLVYTSPNMSSLFTYQFS
jgi:hypothetical protein